MTKPSIARDSDDRRRHEILERTRMGLGEDLEDLRDELTEELQNFEQRLQKIARRLPSWLDLPDDALRSPFELAGVSGLDDTLVGPRTVAVLAGRLEDFVVQWLGDADDIPAWQQRVDNDAIERLRSDLGDLTDLLDDTEEAVDTLADDGPMRLEQLLESVVFELESRRETDVEALESMIHDGDVDPGRNAREEIAELWEEQRRRVDQLQRIWDDILNLHHEGIRRTFDGLDELRGLLSRTREGIAGAGIISPAAAAPKETSGDDSAADRRPDTDEEPEPETAPRDPESDGAESIADEESCSDDSSAPLAPTQPPPEASPTEPNLEKAAEEAAADATPTSGDDTEPDDLRMGETVDLFEQTVDDADNADNDPGESTDGKADLPTEPTENEADSVEQTTEPADQMSTTKVDVSTGGQTAEKQKNTDPDPQEHHTDEPESAVDSRESDEDDSPGDDRFNAPPEEPASIDDIDEPDHPASRPEVATEETSKTDEDETASDELRLRVFRRRDDWHPVGIGEIGATIGPPGLFVAGLFLLSVLALAGLAPNPMTTWDWTLPASFGAMVVLVVLPLVFGWRPMWDNTDFQVIRRGTVEDDVDLRITGDDRLFFDRTSWRLDKLEVTEISRWETDDNTRGWLLIITPPYHSPIHLVSIASDDRRWTSSDRPVVDAPDDAWHLPPGEHRTIERLLGADEN